MNSLFRKTRLEIDLSALRGNVLSLKNLVNPKSFFCPMVKAEAYGHGAIAVSKELESVGVEKLGVALIEEGIALRSAGIKANIYVFGLFHSTDLPALVEHKLTPVVSAWETLHELERMTFVPQGFPVHVKFNTGMNRLGFPLKDAPTLAEFFSSAKKIKLQGLLTHLSDSEDLAIERSVSQIQIENFKKILPLFARVEYIHVFNSAGMFADFFQAHSRMKMNGWGARPGLSIYGIYPQMKDLKSDWKNKISLKPVMSWGAELGFVQSVPRSGKVSYGGRWTASRDSVVGVVPVGYGDGYSRRFSNRGQMLIHGQKIPVVGSVCMDYTMVDLTDVAKNFELNVGDQVVVLGHQQSETLSADDLALQLETIPYEVMTCVGERVLRQYKG